jgi:addiction module HigA family antidote
MSWHHPGKTLDEQFLRPLDLSQNRLARAIQVPPRRINEIVLGKRAITADTAVRLAQYFGNEPAYWMKLQTDYDIALAMNSIGIHLYAIETLEPDETPISLESTSGSHQAPANNVKNHKSIKYRLLR